MTDKDRINLIEKEIKTYRTYKDLVDVMIPIIRKFDGKCFNKKLVEELDVVINKDSNERKYYISIFIEYYMFKIEVHTYDDWVKYEDHGGAGISNNRMSFDVLEKNALKVLKEGGRSRINAEGIIHSLKEKQFELENRAASLEEELTKVDELKENMELIKKTMEEIDNKYSVRIREVFNCYYELKKTHTDIINN